MVRDVYKIAKERAAEEYDPKQPEYWVYVSAFQDGFRLLDEPDNEPFEMIVRRIVIKLKWGVESVDVALKDEVRIRNKDEFILAIKKITNAIEVSIYE